MTTSLCQKGPHQLVILIKEDIGITKDDTVVSTYMSKRKVRKTTTEYFKKKN